MSGIFNTFNIVKRGMAVQQSALNVTAHNVANANTDGYSVQRANIKTTQPFGMPSLNASAEPGQLGTGAEVASITRARDLFLDYQIRRENSTLEKFNVREEYLSEVQSIFNEPSESGIGTCLTQFWDSWQQLSTSCESSTARSLVVSNAQALAQAINHNYNQLSDLQTNASNLIRQDTFEISTKLSQIQDLNKQIRAVVIGGNTPNDLMDSRDLLIDELSKKMNIEVERTDFEGVDISTTINGQKYTIVGSNANDNLNIAYVDDVNYYVDKGTTGMYDEKDIKVLSMDKNNNPLAIEYAGVGFGIYRSAGIDGVEVNGVKLSGSGNTFTFSDGKEIKATGNNLSLEIEGKTLINTAGSWTYNGSAVNIDGNGNITDPTTNKVLLEGLKLKLDTSVTPNTITGFSYAGKNITLNAAGTQGTMSFNNKDIMFNSGDISITDGGTTQTITQADLGNANVKAEVVLYMNGNINQQLRIENISVSNTDLLGQFTSNHTVFFRNDKFLQELHGNETFNGIYDYSKVNSFYFTDAGFENGSLNGYETVSDEIEKYKTQLNNLAKALTISVNTIHSDDGKALDFFDNYAEYSTEPAKVIALNSTIADDPSRINAPKTNGNTGNSARALLIGQLRSIRMNVLDITDRNYFKTNVSLNLTDLTMKSSTSGTTLDNYFQGTISDLGVSGDEAEKMVTNQDSLLSQLLTRRDNISGVSIDEEMTNMIQYQRSYEANAKMISILDSLLDTVINGLIQR